MSNGAKKIKAKSGTLKKAQWRPFLKVYADTNRTGSVDEKQEEWNLRKKAPGAILVYNCDRDSAAPPKIDFEDDDIKNSTELKDFAKLIVKRNKNLKAGYKAFLEISSTDARKVKVFDDYSTAGKACLGKLSSTTESEYELVNIRDRDYTFAIEAQQPVRKAGDETVCIYAVIKKGAAVKFKTYVRFTIAPWLMVSNIEEVEKAYVAQCFTGGTDDNTAFISKLKTILGGKLCEITPSIGDIDRWMQDVIEIGISSTPATKSNPMHQFINSRNSNSSWSAQREQLLIDVKKELIKSNCGHFELSQGGTKSMDSYGNLEVTPPLAKYPFGRIFYGVRNAAFGPGHAGNEMSAEVKDILKANKYQSAVEIPTNWLAVGHVDEFMSFIPDLTGGPGSFKLLIASPRTAIRLCEKLKAAGRGGTKICPGKPGFEISVDDFLDTSGALFKLNSSVQSIIDNIRTNIIRKEFDLPYIKGNDDIIGIPVIFRGTRLGTSKVINAIARTAGMVNCLVVKPKVIVPKPFGPTDASGKDVFEEYTRKKIEALGLTFEPIDDWDTYHTLDGEVHCGTNAKRIPPKDWKWWEHY